MGSGTAHRAVGTAPSRRRFKPHAGRKLAVVIGGVAVGGAVTFAVESAGVPAQLAATVGGTLTALVAAAEELRETRAEPLSERVARLVKGDVYRPPLLMAFYMTLAVFLVTNLISLPISFALGWFLALTSLDQEYAWEVWEPYVYESAVVALVVVMPFVVVPIARSVAHRIRSGAFLWICGALIATWAVGAAMQELWHLMPPREEGGISARWDLVLTGLSLALCIGGAAVGCVWARRTQTTFVMRKLFRQLSRPDQVDLIELVKTLPMAGRGEPASRG